MLYISIREREREREGVGGWKKIECVNPVINLNFSYVLNEIVSDSRSGVFCFVVFSPVITVHRTGSVVLNNLLN